MTRFLPAARVAALALAAACGSAALAQAPTSPAKKELVQRALKLQQQGIENVGNQLAAQLAQQALAMSARAMGNVPADKRELVGNEIQAEVRKYFEDIAPTLRANAVKLAPGTLGATLEEKFTEDEMKVLVTWLESPVSRKYLQAAAEAHQGLAPKVMAESRGALEGRTKALEQSLAKKLGVPLAASAPASGPKK